MMLIGSSFLKTGKQTNKTKKRKTQTKSSSICAMMTQSDDTKSFGAVPICTLGLKPRKDAAAQNPFPAHFQLAPRSRNLLCAAFPAPAHLCPL